MRPGITKIGIYKFLFVCVKEGRIRDFLRVFCRWIIERKKNYIFAAKNENDDVLGYCVSRLLPSKFDFPNKESMIIGPLYVFERYRKKGLGKALVQSACEDSSKPVYSYILKQNAGSRATFTASGFLNIGYMAEKNKHYYLTQDDSHFVVMYYDKRRMNT